jgi:hypothetical protein
MGDSDSRAETINGVAAATTGLGVITVALAPLAIPFIVLTIVALLPLALPLIPLAVLGAVVAGTWIVLRGLVRAVRRPRIARRPAITGKERLT